MDDREWTDADLALIQSLDAGGMALPEIAAKVGRDQASVAERLRLVRSRDGAVPVPDDDWFGPDEEGDVRPVTDRQEDRSGAWVHTDPAKRRKSE